MKHYSPHSLCGHGLHFHKTHHSDTLRSNMAQRTDQAQRMNPIAFIWAIYSHPSLSVWSVGNRGDWLIHQSSLPPRWVQEHERKPGMQHRFNMGRVHSERPFDMSQSDSVAWHTAVPYRWEPQAWKEKFWRNSLLTNKSYNIVSVWSPFLF